MLIINADDWGRNREATDNSLSCFRNGRVTSVSAMVFMEDAERAADLARACGIDAGLHLNFTTPFTGTVRDAALVERQGRIAAFLRPQRLRRLVYHAGLRADFDYVYRRQVEEFARLYGKPPSRIDGHHHMHLCANMLIDRVISRGLRVRRNHSFFAGERTVFNRYYRKAVDAWLCRRHRCTDYFFRLLPLTPGGRIRQIVELAGSSIVEVAVHTDGEEEYRYLMGEEYGKLIHGVTLATHTDW
jgi:predicted glycoside hydrolase/deacetylase ChbG (UPF0249 family)